jgi:uncharacterized protein (TIGR03437 family)
VHPQLTKEYVRMNRFLAATIFAVLATQSPAGISSRPSRRPAERPLSQPAPTHVSRDFGNLPLAFEPNVGQTDSRVRFLARGPGMTTFFTDAETVMVLNRNREQAVVRMKLAGASQPRRVIGLEKLPGISNYFLGNDPAKWRTDVPHYARVQYDGVYPGIDLVWYGNQRRLEYDFVVAPGADPNRIQVAYEGAESLRVETGGDLVLRTALGEVRQQKPRVYQEIGGKRLEVKARYTMVARNRVSFELAHYDRTRELRIDPLVLVYSTYLGGSGGDGGAGIAVDATGSAYITGWTTSTNFPTQSPYQAAFQGSTDAFVTKLSPAGNALVYSTYLGGNGNDWVNGIAVDGMGSAYVTGYTNSTNFPTQSPYQATFQGTQDAFVTKLAPAGNALAYSTYLGGSGEDHAYAIAVDASGSAYVTGWTGSANFPTKSAFQTALQGGTRDVFVTKLTAAGNALVYSTYLGGSANDAAYGIAVAGTGSAYVTGWTYSTNFPTRSAYQATYQGGGYDVFVTKLTPAGDALDYSTYLGGSGIDEANAITVDATGSAYVTGYTASTNFPTKSPYQATFQGGDGDTFVTKLTAAGNALIYSTYLGGSAGDDGAGIALDAVGSAYIVGSTTSTNFPAQMAYQASYQGGYSDVTVTKLTPAGSALSYSTYLGGSGGDWGYAIAVDGSGTAYVTGETASTNFPTQAAYRAAFQGGSADAFVTKLQSDTVPSFTAPGVANAANYVAGKVSPGEIVVIFGKDFSPPALAGLQLVNGMVATETGETRVLFDGVAAPMVYAVNGQISCVVPYEVAGKTTTQIVVEYKKVKSLAVAVPVVEAVPGLFSINSSGTGPGAFLNEDNSVNTAANPLERGKIAIFYGTGEGQTTPAGVNGLPATTAFPKPLLPVTVTIGGKNAEVLYAGAAPYMVAGVMQINAKVPTDIAAGNAEVIIKVGSLTSQAGITLAVK